MTFKNSFLRVLENCFQKHFLIHQTNFLLMFRKTNKSINITQTQSQISQALTKEILLFIIIYL